MLEFLSLAAMKFSQQLKFNSVPEWKEDYMNYAQLKKMIYQEEAILQVQSIGGGRAASEMRAGAHCHMTDCT